MVHEEGKEFAILTNEISKATFGVPIKEHKQIKGLDPKFKNQNLRDHMNDLELIFSMLGEKVTTEITKKEDSQEFVDCLVQISVEPIWRKLILKGLLYPELIFVGGLNSKVKSFSR